MFLLKMNEKYIVDELSREMGYKRIVTNAQAWLVKLMWWAELAAHYICAFHIYHVTWLRLYFIPSYLICRQGAVFHMFCYEIKLERCTKWNCWVLYSLSSWCRSLTALLKAYRGLAILVLANSTWKHMVMEWLNCCDCYFSSWPPTTECQNQIGVVFKLLI